MENLDWLKEKSDLDVKEEFVSFHALNPFVANNSSARSYMFSSHASQALTIINPEEKIIQSGLENQFSNNTFSIDAENDYRVIAHIKRYRGIDTTVVNEVIDDLFIVENIETGEYDYILVPLFHKLHNYFGFKNIKNQNVYDTINKEGIIKKGTRISQTPGIKKNNGYGFGINANICLMNLPETTEDGVVISESFADRLAYDIFETRVVEFGSKYFPLNVYKSGDNYKPFPEIGETVNDESIIMALRAYDDVFGVALTSINDVTEFNPLFDKAFYVREPGSEKQIKLKTGETISVKSGTVVDIKCYLNGKYKKDLYTGTYDNVEKYANSLIMYYRDILDVYNKIKEEHWKRYKNNNVPISEKLHRLIVEANAIANPNKNKIQYSNRNELLDSVRIEFTIKYTIIPTIAHKITDSHGSKGVIVSIRKKEEMPYTIVNGEKVIADVVMDPGSVVSRMNIGRIYEQYFNAMARRVRSLLRQELKVKYITEDAVVLDTSTINDKTINKAYSMLLDFLKLLDTEQYIEYNNVKDINTKLEILKECVEDEVYILYRVSSKKKPYEIVLEVQGTKFEPELSTVFIPIADGKIKETKQKIFIAPIYTFLLNKTGNDYLTVSSSKINHFGVPISVSAATRNNLPWRNSPTKILSETETRLVIAYGSQLAIAEIKDRANNNETHKELYKNILIADKPTNIDKLIDRNVFHYGTDNTLELLNNIFNSAGIEISYDD